MARNPVRDERQGDLFGAPLPPVKPTLRTSLPKPAREEMRAVEPVPLGALGELAYLAIEATRLVKRRLARGQGGLQPKGSGQGRSPLDDALRRIGGELMEVEHSAETW
jgi:hypothetical protein